MPEPLTPESIKDLRSRLGLSQGDFAVLLNERVPGLKTHQVTVARWETGTFRPSAVASYALRALMQAPPQSI